MFLKVSPIGCKTMKINKRLSKNMNKSWQNWWRIHVKSMPCKNIENDANMEPKWSSTSSKIHEQLCNKNITKQNAKMKPRKLWARSGPWAQRAGKRWGVPQETPGQASLLQVINIITQTSIGQTIKKQNPRTSGSTSHALDVPAGTLRIY